uniref:Nucleoside triphosphate pyrophosphohydrolase n=1 Tax=Candidatus Kentrum sp. FM TaxID=2126340 RepID=A0A450TVK7_9GAMM|nr:MAG: ATP diphosphatase [Candidatus Kentron sp. FM]VFJ72928.1 MAG: ATP diphosphatase [Candidatus Kentron sp. FM]VFK20150.1 MAG: ATP diphosphatase [Candidatus Kentron sp. FM]
MTEITPLLHLMERLRDPQNGCPWDRAQTFESIVAYTVEEAYEVADAISRDHMADLASELGDLLFHVVFHARIAQEANLFDFGDVVTGVVDKMTRRHPHVFAGETAGDLDALSVAWEDYKVRERGQSRSGGAQASLLDRVTKGLPATRRAFKLQKKAAEVRFDWTGSLPVLEKVREETAEIEQAIRADDKEAIRAEMGDLLFTCINLARHLDVDPDGALREANGKFERRFRRMEGLLASRGKTLADLGPAELDGVWEEIKAEERTS